MPLIGVAGLRLADASRASNLARNRAFSSAADKTREVAAAGGKGVGLIGDALVLRPRPGDDILSSGVKLALIPPESTDRKSVV